MRRDEVSGLEYDFLACDVVGFVGFFSTAGAGYPPRGLLEHADLHQRAVEAIMELAAITDGRCSARVAKGLRNDWDLMTRRGVFAYDSHPNGGPYVRCGIPGLARQVFEFPPLVREAALSVRLQLEFSRSGVIGEEAFV